MSQKIRLLALSLLAFCLLGIGGEYCFRGEPGRGKV